MGIATEEEVQKVLLLKQEYPEFKEALANLEFDMEVLAQGMAVTPPAGTLEKIEAEINEIQLRNQAVEKSTGPKYKYDNDQEQTKQETLY